MLHQYLKWTVGKNKTKQKKNSELVNCEKFSAAFSNKSIVSTVWRQEADFCDF